MKIQQDPSRSIAAIHMRRAGGQSLEVWSSKRRTCEAPRLPARPSFPGANIMASGRHCDSAICGAVGACSGATELQMVTNPPLHYTRHKPSFIELIMMVMIHIDDVSCVHVPTWMLISFSGSFVSGIRFVFGGQSLVLVGT